MDGTKAWRVTPNAPDKTIINQIMLRYRPIAPKPVLNDSASDGLTPGKLNAAVLRKRVKRKYVRVSKNNAKKRTDPKTLSNDEVTVKSEVNGVKNDVFTLQLLPEKSDLESLSKDRTWLDLNRNDNDNDKNNDSFDFIVGKDLTDVSKSSDRTAVMSWVMLESVTSNCMGEGAYDRMGCTDVDRVNNLERDTCPGFISDGFDKVVWVNQAYMKMVTGDYNNNNNSNGDELITVKLVVKEKLLLLGKESPAFMGLVKWKYDTWQKEMKNMNKKKVLLTVPCDVWRMDFGGFAWRLDVKAALRLGL
ncbi:hypothetical protein ACFE04_008970 [Oxalis oulophora]